MRASSFGQVGAMSVAIAWSVLAWPTCPFAAPIEVIETSELREQFGVSPPVQIVEFDLHRRVDPAPCFLLDADGREVAFHVLGGKRLAVATDLPAGSLRVMRRGACHEITNGVIGVRVPIAPAQPNRLAAPVQGVLLRDGTWTAREGTRFAHPGGAACSLPDTPSSEWEQPERAAHVLPRGSSASVPENCMPTQFARPAVTAPGAPVSISAWDAAPQSPAGSPG